MIFSQNNTQQLTDVDSKVSGMEEKCRELQRENDVLRKEAELCNNEASKWKMKVGRWWRWLRVTS